MRAVGLVLMVTGGLFIYWTIAALKSPPATSG